MPLALLLWTDRKRQGRRSVVALSAGVTNRLLFIQDTVSGRRFLCDTGAQWSIIPSGRSEVAKGEHGPQLVGADGTPIRSYGTRAVDVCFGGQRFTWDFVVAAVTFPLLGADFLCAHNLLVDVGNRRLVNSDFRFLRLYAGGGSIRRVVQHARRKQPVPSG